MLLPHIHREGSTLAPAGHRGEAGKQTSHPSSSATAQSRGAAVRGKIKEQVKALMLKPLGHLTLQPGTAGEPRSSKHSPRGSSVGCWKC